jgi:hypothetical protein
MYFIKYTIKYWVSKDYQIFDEQTSTYESRYTKADTYCLFFNVTIEFYSSYPDYPHLTQNFRGRVSITSSVVQNDLDFVSHFGTHFYRWIVLGAKY